MENHDASQLSPNQTPEDQPDLGTATTPPRENPDIDSEKVRKAEEELDDVVGN